MSSATLVKPRFRFRLLRGRHSQMEPNPAGGEPIQRFYAAEVFDRKGNRMWAKNDNPDEFADPPNIVESDLELDKLFNPKGEGEPKFQRLREVSEEEATTNAPPAALMNDGLDAMTVKQLQELAAAEEIDLHGETKKQTIIEAIRASR